VGPKEPAAEVLTHADTAQREWAIGKLNKILQGVGYASTLYDGDAFTESLKHCSPPGIAGVLSAIDFFSRVVKPDLERAGYVVDGAWNEDPQPET
jgi:hypothetical protein